MSGGASVVIRLLCVSTLVVAAPVLAQGDRVQTPEMEKASKALLGCLIGEGKTAWEARLPPDIFDSYLSKTCAAEKEISFRQEVVELSRKSKMGADNIFQIANASTEFLLKYVKNKYTEEWKKKRGD